MALHELRHFCATYLLELGLAPAVVAVQLGHTDGGALVMSTYGDPSDRAARARITAAMDGHATGELRTFRAAAGPEMRRPWDTIQHSATADLQPRPLCPCYRATLHLPGHLVAVVGLGARAGIETAGQPRSGPRHCCAHACRDAEVVCARVELTVREDARLGLAPRERRRVAARFVGHLHPALRRELSELVRRRGAVARRAAERMAPIELVFDDPERGLQRIVGWVQPPQRRNGDLREIEFDLREPTT